MTFTELQQSKVVRGILIGLGIAILVLTIFKIGEFAGYHKARFSEGYGDNFRATFSDPHRSPFALDEGMMPGGHGAAGTIISVALPKMVIAGPDNLEKTVVLGDTTLIRKYQQEGTAADLAVDEFVVVLGEPDANGQVNAKLVRILPAPGKQAPK